LTKLPLTFCKAIAGVSQGAPSSGILLEFAFRRIHSRATCRAINYWTKISALPADHIMKDCINKQLQMLEKNKKCWLFHIRRILFATGFGYVWENGGPGNPKLFKVIFKERINDIYCAFDFEAASNLSSLDHFLTYKQESSAIEKHLLLVPAERRCITLLRLNMKYSLPWNSETNICKKCDSIMESTVWDHFLYHCESLPPLPIDFSIVPYPYCVKHITRPQNKPLLDRIVYCTSRT
jgi:hypothetical protein